MLPNQNTAMDQQQQHIQILQQQQQQQQHQTSTPRGAQQQQQQQQQQHMDQRGFPFPPPPPPMHQMTSQSGTAWALDYDNVPPPGLEQSIPEDFDPGNIKDLSQPPAATFEKNKQPTYQEFFASFDEEKNRATMAGHYFKTFGEVYLDRSMFLGRNDARFEKIRFRSSRPYCASDGSIKRFETTINKGDVLGFLNGLSYFVPECVASNSAAFMDFCRSAPIRMLMAQVAFQNRLRLVPIEE